MIHDISTEKKTCFLLHYLHRASLVLRCAVQRVFLNSSSKKFIFTFVIMVMSTYVAYIYTVT